MSEDSQNEKNTTIEEIEPKHERDWFLQTLVSMANNSQNAIQIGITLLTHGFLVSGKLISGKEYFSGVAEEFASGFTDIENAAAIKRGFEGMVNKVYDRPENSEIPPPGLLHLKDAKFFHTNGNPIPGNRGVWWRGRISEISGFSLGSLEALELPNK